MGIDVVSFPLEAAQVVALTTSALTLGSGKGLLSSQLLAEACTVVPGCWLHWM